MAEDSFRSKRKGGGCPFGGIFPMAKRERGGAFLTASGRRRIRFIRAAKEFARVAKRANFCYRNTPIALKFDPRAAVSREVDYEATSENAAASITLRTLLIPLGPTLIAMGWFRRENESLRRTYGGRYTRYCRIQTPYINGGLRK